MPALSMSASRDDDGATHLSIVNAHAKEAIELACELKEVDATSVAGRILTAEELDAHNTFDEPERVKPANFDNVSLNDGKLTANIPPRSVVVLTLNK